MKRLLSCLLCMLLLLSFCGCSLFQKLDGPGMVNDDPAGGSSWHKPSVPNGTQATDSPEEPDTEAPTEAPMPRETTASGAEILTDYSHYSPREGLPQANYTRLSEAPIPDLQPGNYGPIYPFAAEALYSNGEGGYSWLQGRYYGFVTADGKIVCDPTYVEVSTVFYYNYEINMAKKIPLWTFARTANIREETYEDSTWLEGDAIYGVAAMDGSWVIPCQFVGVQGTDEGFIGTRSWNDCDFDVYDMKGQQIFGYEDLKSKIPFGEYCSVSYSEGVYIVYTNDKYYALDGKGDLLFGPMAQLGSFSGGIAPASENNMYYGYVDKTGKWALQPFYDSASPFSGDYAVVTTGRGQAVIDRSGNYTLEMDEDGYLSIVGDQYAIFNPYETNCERLYDAATGALLMETREQEYLYHLHDGLFYSNVYDDNTSFSTVYLYDLQSGKQVNIPGANYVLDPKMYEFSYGMDSTLYYKGTPCLAVHIWNPDDSTEYGGTSTYVFYDYKLKQLDRLENTEVSSTTDLVSGENYLYLGAYGSRVYRCYRADGSVLGRFSDNNYSQIMNGYLQVTDDFSARLYDPSGKEVFCLPLMGMLND